MHIILLVVFAGNAQIDYNKVQTILTFGLSVFSAAFGMTKFMSVGPCRLIPYDKINVGFFLVLLCNASCLVGKGFLLAASINATGPLGTHTTSEYTRKVGYWVSLSLLPSLMFVSTYLKSVYNFCLSNFSILFQLILRLTSDDICWKVLKNYSSKKLCTQLFWLWTDFKSLSHKHLMSGGLWKF